MKYAAFTENQSETMSHFLLHLRGYKKNSLTESPHGICSVDIGPQGLELEAEMSVSVKDLKP